MAIASSSAAVSARISRSLGSPTSDLAGPPDHCVRRLKEFAALGLDKVAISGGTRSADPTAAETAHDLMRREVLSAIKG